MYFSFVFHYSQSTRVASQLERLRKDLDSQEQQLAALSQPCVQRLNTLLGKVCSSLGTLHTHTHAHCTLTERCELTAR